MGDFSMNKKIIITLILAIGVLICVSPIMAADNSVHQFALFDFNIFGGDTPSLDVEKLQIQKVKKSHTYSNGNTKKSTKTYLKFNLSSSSDSMGNYSVTIKCFDKNKKSIKTVKSYVDHEGSYKIPLSGANKVKSAKITIKDDSGNVLFNKTTSKIKISEKVTKDKPVEKKKTTSSSSKSSSSSGATYWGSSKSGKFHRPSCEWAQKIYSNNKVVFHSRSEAINAGYQPCQVCSP